MFRSIAVLVGGLATLSVASLFAQDAVLGQKYGQGVHDYFAGDCVKAYEQLSAAIEGGSKDPRAFYFRGLACLNLGRSQDSALDFRKGAELESSDVNKFYNVAKALERVQGPARAELENYRVDARMAALEQAEKIRKARYEAIQREETRVLREQAAAAPAEPIATPAPESNAAADPFAASEDEPAPKAVKQPAKRAVAEKKTVAAPAGDDPFAAKPADKASTAKKASVPGTVAPASDAKKPAKPAEKKAAPDDPFAS